MARIRARWDWHPKHRSRDSVACPRHRDQDGNPDDKVQKCGSETSRSRYQEFLQTPRSLLSGMTQMTDASNGPA